MLVIRRRANESFSIGDSVEVVILEIEGSQVKLGIRAPREIAILRSEVIETRRANQKAARRDLPADFPANFLSTLPPRSR